jgi:hypothetical protein
MRERERGTGREREREREKVILFGMSCTFLLARASRKVEEDTQAQNTALYICIYILNIYGGRGRGGF